MPAVSANKFRGLQLWVDEGPFRAAKRLFKKSGALAPVNLTRPRNVIAVFQHAARRHLRSYQRFARNNERLLQRILA